MLLDTAIATDGGDRTKSLVSSGNKQLDRFTKLECPLKHAMSSSPSHVAVKGDSIWALDDVAFGLEVVKDFNTLASGLDLLEPERRVCSESM